MTLTEIFEYKKSLDVDLSKIDKKSKLYFTIIIESNNEFTKRSDFCENEYQVKELIFDATTETRAKEIYNAFLNRDLIIDDGKYTYNSFKDPSNINCTIKYVIDIRFESRD